MLYYFLLLCLVLNCFLLLLSPLYHHKNKLLRWYYVTIFRRISLVLKDPRFWFLRWTVPLFYCGLVLSFAVIYYFWILNDANFSQVLVSVSTFENIILIPVLVLSNLGLLVLCHHKSFDNSFAQIYPFDYILYFPNNVCRTCNKSKPARSKHCSKCNRCINGQDHHCIWLNCCISDLNFVCFDLLLLNNLIGVLYASIRSGTTLLHINRKFAFHFKNVKDPEFIFESFKMFRKHLLTIFILSFCFALVLTWFISTQVELIFSGMTTNESDKWFVIHRLIEEKLVYRIDEKLYVLADDDGGTITRFNSINFYDTRVFVFANITKENQVESAYEIDNIYDCHSFMANLRQRWGY